MGSSGGDIVERVPVKERTFSGPDYFLLWGGAAVSLAEILAGGILAPLGFITGFLIIIGGHIIGNTPLALGGIIGSEEGIPTMMSTRPAFGIKGSYLAALLNIIQLVGWTAIMLIICGEAANSILKELAGISHVKVLILISGIITTAWAVVGHKTWRWLQRVSVTALLLLCLVMIYAVFKDGIPTMQIENGMPKAIALDLVIAMPISWLPLVSDYSRYASNTKSCFTGTWVGYFLISCLMYTVGLGAAIYIGVAEPVPMMLALGLGIPALLIVFLSTFTTTFLDVYSTAISALNIWTSLDERKGVIIGGILGTALALIFPMEQYENFLLLIGSMFCPLFGVVLTDYFVIKKSYADDSIFTTASVNWRAILAWGVGVVIYRLLLRTNIGASIPSMILAAVLYGVLMMKKTRR
ncbi:MAG: putative hydroxymethylpyrimidine transporter CytX [Theionarchaea archaeon]|nr:putative hydroxymethylpyrimidine transporter CytX [Theionarchaea archaeon]